jgi:hypothetical protein
VGILYVPAAELTYRAPVAIAELPVHSMDTYVLCRPRGGLNDTLNQIERCWRYAERTDRRLVIDTMRSGMLDHWANYFAPVADDGGVITKLDDDLLDELDATATFPHGLSGRLRSYEALYFRGVEAFADRQTRQILSFDFSRDYTEPLLFHEQFGSGKLAIDCLARLKLSATIAASVSTALGRLGMDYDAVHVRNTDYRTDYESFFARILDRVTGRRVLVCSDDAACIDFARAYFNRSDVLTVSTIPCTDGRPLHGNPELDRLETNSSMLVDLLALASARNLFISRIAANRHRTIYSGFSALALGLLRRPDVRLSLLDAGVAIP